MTAIILTLLALAIALWEIYSCRKTALFKFENDDNRFGWFEFKECAKAWFNTESFALFVFALLVIWTTYFYVKL